MGESLLLHGAILVALLSASAFFAASETAFFSLNFIRVKHLQAQAERRGNLVARLILRPQELIVTLLMGNELVNIAVSSLIGAWFIGKLGPRGEWYAVGVTAALLLVFGEIIPKTLAVAYPLGVARRSAPLLRAFSFLTALPNRLIRRVSDGVVSLLGGEGEADLVTEDEFKGLIREGRRLGVLDRDEEDIIYNILEMGDLTLSSLMTPRTEILALDEGTTVGQALEVLRREPHSRIPVYSGSIDNITGVLHVKDLLASRARGELRTEEAVGALAKPPLVVPVTMRADDLLVEFRNRGVQLAVAVDEYGGTAGLVTMEDLLRQLFEDVTRGASPDAGAGGHPDVSRIAEGVYAVPGRLPVEEFNRLFDTRFPDAEYNTIGGVLFHLFGRLPRRGEELRWGNLLFRVTAVAERRIEAFRVERRAPREEP